MSLLKTITRGVTPAPRRILLYGTHGIGKSTFSSHAPGAVFIPTEDGLGEIDCAKFPVAKTFSAAIDAIGALYSEPHEYRTVVIDSLDWLERLIWAEVCEARGVKAIDDIPYAKGYGFAMEHWANIINGLDALREEKGMTTILIAHSKIEKFENPETDTYDRYTPRLHKYASALVQEWCDEVLFANYKVFTKKREEGFGREKVQGVSTGERILRTQERPAHVAKNRLGLPEELPLDWAEYAKFININHGDN